MTTGDEVIELFREHVAYDDERVESAFGLPGGRELALQTNQASFVVREIPKFLRIGEAPWVRSQIIFERDDIFAAGAPETFTLVLLEDGGVLAVNKEEVVRELGKRLFDDLDVPAYVDILARYHPWTSAWVEVVTEAGQLAREYGHDDLPDPPLPQIERDGDTLRAKVQVAGIYQHGVAAARMLKVTSWEIDAWRDQPAQWRTEQVVRDILIDRYEPSTGSR